MPAGDNTGPEGLGPGTGLGLGGCLPAETVRYPRGLGYGRWRGYVRDIILVPEMTDAQLLPYLKERKADLEESLAVVNEQITNVTARLGDDADITSGKDASSQ